MSMSTRLEAAPAAACHLSPVQLERLRRLLVGRDYGTSSGCGSSIPYERLEVVPAAARCVSCQVGRDRALH